MNALYSAVTRARGGAAFRGVTGTAGAHLPPPVLMACSWRKQLHPTRTGRRRSARSSPSPVWLYLFNLALARVCVGGWSVGRHGTECSKELSVTSRREREGPDKEGEVYHEPSSTEEAAPLPRPTVETVEPEKMAVISALIQPV